MANYTIEAGAIKNLTFNLSNCSLKTDLKFTLHKDAQLNLKLIAKGEVAGELILQIDLVGTGANAKVDGALYLQGQSSFKINSIQNHLVNDAISDLNIRTVLTDETVFDYKGMIFIAENGSRTNANQQNKNIVIGNKVSVASIPNIEVLNADVQCGHGSAIGGLDQEQLHYLMSRGLSYEKAQNLLLNSFLNY